MAGKVYLKLVSATGLILEQSIDMVVLPGHDGDMGILPHHAPLIAHLRSGLVRFYDNNSVTKQIFITEGFVQIDDKSCTLLVDEWVLLEQLNAQELNKQLDKITQTLDLSDNHVEQRILQDHITTINSQLNFVGHA